LKRLAENTTRACRSLSSGLNEVQQATVSIDSQIEIRVVI
jgi:hypothetical protein